MDLFRSWFGPKNKVAPPPSVTAPSRSHRRIITIVPDEPHEESRPTVAPAAVLPDRESGLENRPAPAPVSTPPKESAEQLLEKMRVRSVRRKELAEITALENELSPDQRTAKMAAMKQDVADAIEADVDQRRYRVAFYLYQSAVHAARRVW